MNRWLPLTLTVVTAVVLSLSTWSFIWRGDAYSAGIMGMAAGLCIGQAIREVMWFVRDRRSSRRRGEHPGDAQ